VSAHGFGDGQPLSDGEQAIDAKADEEDNERAFDDGGIAAGMQSDHRPSNRVVEASGDGLKRRSCEVILHQRKWRRKGKLLVANCGGLLRSVYRRRNRRNGGRGVV
jgi:hypothetical protein